MSGRGYRRLALGLMLSAGASLLMAFAPPDRSAVAPTGLTGMWSLSPEDAENDQKLVMPLTPAAQVIRAAQKKAIQSGDVIGENAKKCAPEGMPTMMVNEFALEFLETPDRVTIVNEASTLVRSVYLDEPDHTPGLEPSWNGHSIGHWEGQTLVIDTVNFNDKAGLFGFIGVHSSTTHLVERFRVIDGGQSLEGQFTFEDPRYLTQPWTHTVHYRRLPPHSELWEYACEPGGGWVERFNGDTAGKAPSAKAP